MQHILPLTSETIIIMYQQDMRRAHESAIECMDFAEHSGDRKFWLDHAESEQRQHAYFYYLTELRRDPANYDEFGYCGVRPSFADWLEMKANEDWNRNN